MGLFGGGSGADWLIAGLGNPEPKYDGTRHNTESRADQQNGKGPNPNFSLSFFQIS